MLYLSILEWLRSQEEGQTLVEYALILVLIAIVVIVAVALVGDAAYNIFEEIAGNLNE